MDFFYVLFLSMAVSLDALAAGAAYGTKGIHMPIGSLGIVTIVTIVCVALAMGGAHLLGGFIDAHVATVTGALVLVVLGVYRLLLDFLTPNNATNNNVDIPSHDPGNQVAARKLTFAVGDLVIKIMAKPEAADIDRSQHISAVEAMFLGVALGVDNMVAASAANLGEALPTYTPLAMAVVQTAFISAGLYGSERLIHNHIRFHLSYVSGAVLVLLGIVRLV